MRSRTHAWWLGAIVLVGLAVRLAYQVEQSATAGYRFPVSDAAFNDYWARSAATGSWSGEEHPTGPIFRTLPYIKAPGYLVFLTTVYRVAGTNPVVPRAVQLGLGLASLLLCYRLGRRLFSPLAGLYAAALFSTYWVFIFYEGELHAPSLVVFLVLLLLEMLLSVRNGPRALATGLVFGFALLVRKNLLLFLPLACWWLARKRTPPAPRLLLPLLAGVVLSIAPVTWRNLQASGEWVPISCDAGRNLYIGNNPSADGLHPYLPELASVTGSEGWSLFDYPVLHEAAEKAAGRSFSPAGLDRWFAARAWHFTVAHPAQVLRLTARKLLYTFSPVEISSDRVVYYDRLASPVLRHLPLAFPMVLALAVAGAGLLFVRRRSRPGGQGLLLVALFATSYFISFLPGLPESRYRVGWLPVLMMFGGYALAEWTLWARGRTFRKASGLAAAVCLLFVLFHGNPLGYQPDRAKWLFEQGVVAERAGQAGAARAAYEAALRARPSFVEARTNLGILLAGTGHAGAAEACFTEVLRLKPSYAPGYRNRAMLYLEQGRNREAIDSLRGRPENAETLALLGMALVADGQLAAAEPVYRKALALRPADAALYNNLGVVYLRQERFLEARRQFEQALLIQPGYPDAQQNLLALQQR